MNILTFDVEDWYNCDFISQDFNWKQYEVRIYEGVDRILKLLEDNRQKATFFCLGWMAENHPNVINEIHNNGHQIGCHSNIHQLVTRFKRAEFQSDTLHAINCIEDLIGEKVKLYRAPGFSITEQNTWAFEILVELGIEIDCSVFPAKHEYGGLPSFGKAEPAFIEFEGHRIKEFPINTRQFFYKEIVFSGGGYFRLFPYWLINHWMAQSEYVMTYFHPRDFDSDQPMLPHLPLHRKLKSYVGIRGAFSKFEKLLKDFEFVNIDEADKLFDWGSAKTIRIV